ncbi:hypothetical protein Tco_0445755 [Tanacetum coccineum]
MVAASSATWVVCTEGGEVGGCEVDGALIGLMLTKIELQHWNNHNEGMLVLTSLESIEGVEELKELWIKGLKKEALHTT